MGRSPATASATLTCWPMPQMGRDVPSRRSAPDLL